MSNADSNSAITGKRCTKCGAVKHLSEFSRQKLGKYGRTANCKTCRLAFQRELYWRNVGKSRADRLRYYYETYASDPSYVRKARERSAKWYEANRDRILSERAKIRRKRETAKATPPGTKRCGACHLVLLLEAFPRQTGKSDGRYSVCSGCKRLTGLSYYARVRDKRLAQQRKKFLERPEVFIAYCNKRRAWRVGADDGTVTAAAWLGILKRFGRRCYYCNKPLKRPVMEHKIPLCRGGLHSISNIVPACKPCNSRKHRKTAEEFFAVLMTDRALR